MDPVLGEFLSISNIVFCILFGIEMIMKWIAYGMKKYFTDFWTILDFAIVCVSIMMHTVILNIFFADLFELQRHFYKAFKFN